MREEWDGEFGDGDPWGMEYGDEEDDYEFYDDEFYDDEVEDGVEAAEEDVERGWGLEDEDEDFDLEWEDGESEEEFRERVMVLLGIEAVVDTKHRTVLKRRAVKQEGQGVREGIWSRLMGGGKGGEKKGGGQETKEQHYYFNYERGKSLAARILKIAQDHDVVGIGIDGDYEQAGVNFFNEIIDFSWPPEQQWVEQDCTCEMWDRIRYKY